MSAEPGGLTLYVIHTDRAPEIAADCVAAARWTSKYTSAVLLVVGAGGGDKYRDCGADLVYESAVPAGSPLTDFRFYDGIAHVINLGWDFEQVICFRDDAAFLGKGADAWVADFLYKEPVVSIAAADRLYYGDHFLLMGEHFARWHIPHEIWDKPPATFTANTAVFAVKRSLVQELFYRRLLLPPRYEDWPLPFGPYFTWTSQLLMLTPVLRGSMERPLAPLYVNDGWGGTYNAPPYMLHPSVLFYWSLRRVAGYTETETRAWCKQLRQASQ